MDENHLKTCCAIKNRGPIADPENTGAIPRVLEPAMSWRGPFNVMKDHLRLAGLGFIDHLGLPVQIGYLMEKEVRIMHRAMFPVASSSKG